MNARTRGNVALQPLLAETSIFFSFASQGFRSKEF